MPAVLGTEINFFIRVKNFASKQHLLFVQKTFEMRPRITAKRTNRLQDYTTEEKLSLIQAVRKRPLLWELTHKYHYDGRHSKSAWKSIAAELNKDPVECRTAWNSLTDSFRYYRKRSAKYAVPGDNDDGIQNVDWEFAESMSFLLATKSPYAGRSKIINTYNDDDSLVESVEYNDQLDKNDTSYKLAENGISEDGSLSNNPPKRSKKQPQQSEQLSSILEGFLNKQEELLAQPTVAPIPELSEHYGALQYWDSLLKTMSPARATRAKFSVTDLLQAMVRSQMDKNK